MGVGAGRPAVRDDPYGGGCVPMIDEVRYETVRIDVARLGGSGPSVIWAVTTRASDSTAEFSVVGVSVLSTPFGGRRRVGPASFYMQQCAARCSPEFT